jgi:3-deoxy-7-phosphoheptulonate synthase
MTDINIIKYNKLSVPQVIIDKYPINIEDKEFIEQSRQIIKDILDNKNKKKIAIVGPCSIHNFDLAIDYAKQLKEKISEYENLFIVMRVYFEKPRSRGGWKGFVYDPELDDSCNIELGMNLARKLLVTLTKMRIPVACEFLDVTTPQYFSDIVSWGAIGARTTESQIHRQLASGLSMPIGFKNSTDGKIKNAIDGIISSGFHHSFLGIGYDGLPYHVQTRGNKYSHLILRGGDSSPNYDQESLEKVMNEITKDGITKGIIIDCSHGNSLKLHTRQPLVAFSIARLIRSKKYPIAGVMIESNINAGSQKLTKEIKYGISITDECVDLETTFIMLNELNIVDTIDSIKITDINTVRDLLKECELSILEKHKFPKPISENDIIINFDNDIVSIESTDMRKMMGLHRRICLGQKVADIKFNNETFKFMLKDIDPYILVTDREIEDMVIKRTNTEFYKIIEVTKKIEIEYIEKISSRKTIGYLGGKGSFSYDAICKFKGEYIPYLNKTTLFSDLKSNTIDFCLLPIYNSLIGKIYNLNDTKILGTIEQVIDICLLSNTDIINIKNKKSKKLYVQEIIKKEAIEFIEKIGFDEIIVFETTTDACRMCISDLEQAYVLASKNNISNYLHLIKDKIINHNITTFGLIQIIK